MTTIFCCFSLTHEFFLMHEYSDTFISIDFLDVLPESIDFDENASRSALLDCCAAFGRSRHDLNISLTATGMLWTIADQDSTLASLNVSLLRVLLLHLLYKSLLTFMFCTSECSIQTCNIMF